MKIEKTKLQGCFYISPKVHFDSRGYFFEAFNKKVFEKETDTTFNILQTNQSRSSKGVLRGLHFQCEDAAQAKLVRVLSGKVQDVCVDLRPNSKTFGQSVSIILEAEKHNQLFIPRGFAHGFLVLENDTIFSYSCDNFYSKSSESGIKYNDIDLNINWLLPREELILSEKDKKLQSFSDYKKSI